MPRLNSVLSKSYAQAYRVNRTIRAKQRRPATQPRPSGVLGAPDQPQGTASPLFATQGSNTTNHVGQGGDSVFGQPNRASQSFDQSSPPNPFRLPPNVSFPPFQGSTNTDFKPAFAVPPSSDFAFTPPPVTNPFSFPNPTPTQSSGFQGSIFNIPPSTPFGTSTFSAGGDTAPPKAAAQPVFSWGSPFGSSEAQSKPQSNIFNTTSTAPKPEQQPMFTFGQSFPQSQQPPSKIFGQNSPSLFADKTVFTQTPSQIEPQTKSLTANAPAVPNAPEQQTITNLFVQQASSTSQPQVVESSPRKDEDRMSTTPDSSPQAKGSATLRPFEFLNHSPKGPEKDNANSQDVQRDVFGGTSQPAIVSENSTVAGLDSHSSRQDVAPAFTLKPPGDLAGFSQPSTLAGNSTEQTSPIRNNEPKATLAFSMPSSEAAFTLRPPGDFAGFSQPFIPAGNTTEQTSPTRDNEPAGSLAFSMPPSEVNGVATSGLFRHLNIPSPSPSLQSSADLAPFVPTERSTLQASYESSLPVSATDCSSPTAVRSGSDQLTLETIFKDPIWGKTPVAPQDFTDAQREQLAIGYQLRCVDVGLQQHILKNRFFHLESELVTKFYLDLKRRILNGEGLAAHTLAGKKRKASQDEGNDQSYGKRAKLDIRLEPIPADKKITNGGWLNAPNRPKSLLTEPASLPQVAMSESHTGEKVFMNNVERPSEVAQQVPNQGTVSYPSLSTSSGSITSNLFKNILERKDQDSTSDIQIGESGGNKETDASTRLQENSSSPDLSIHNNPSSLFSEIAAPSAKPVPPFTPLYPVIQYLASPNPVPAISTTNGTPSSSVTQGSSLTLPKFGSAQPANFFSQFGKIAEENIQKEKASRKADEFDSDEDDEAEWERKDAEQQRAKKQKLDETVKSKTAKFVPGKGFIVSDQETERQALGSTHGFDFSGSLNGTTSLDANKSVLSSKSHSLGNGHNIFGHLSDVESGAEGSKIGDADDEETDSDGAVDDDGGNDATPRVASDESQHRDGIHDMGMPSEPLADVNPFGPSSAFAAKIFTNASPDTSEQSHNVGRSIFDRISKDKDGKVIREVTPPTDKRDETLVGAPLPASNSIFKQGKLGAGTNIFSQRTPEAGVSIFGQTNSERRANMFGQQTSNATANIFGQRDLEAEDNILDQQNSTFGAHIIEDQTLGAGANVLEQPNSEARANAFEQPNSETEADVVEQGNSEAKAEVDEEREGAEANVDEKGNSGAEANISGQHDAETGANIVGQVPSSAPDKADDEPILKPSLLSTIPITSVSSSTPLFTFAGSPGGDNTWKVNSPIKFGSSSSGPPGLTLTSPTPSKPSLGGLFGSPSANLTPDTPAKPPTSIFSFNAGKAPAVGGFGFNFGGPPTATIGSLAAPPAASNATSRATSPGITTGDNSAAESNAEGTEDGPEKHEQLNLADKGPGEEDEEVLFAVKAKAMIFESSDKGWATRGVGKLRVLKHRDTSKTRVLLKQDPSGKIILNAALLSTMKYEYMQNKSVKLGVATDVGKLVTWLIRTGKDEDAVELARILEENKSN